MQARTRGQVISETAGILDTNAQNISVLIEGMFYWFPLGLFSKFLFILNASFAVLHHIKLALIICSYKLINNFSVCFINMRYIE
jgi:hypothetical protein